MNHESYENDDNIENIPPLLVDGQASKDTIYKEADTFELQPAKKNHLKCQETTLNLDTLVCPESRFVFSTKENLRIHIENVHSMSELFVNPKHKEAKDQSGYAASRRETLNTHGETVHKMGERKFKCDMCPYKSTILADLKIHIKGVHECEECGYAASPKETLNTHKATVHKMGEKKFKCEKCPFKSFHRPNLNKHINTVHDKMRDHVCDDCGYSTSQKGTLNRNRATVHKTGEKKFKCEKCPFKSFRRPNLKMHIKQVHEKIRDYVCDDCGYSSSQKATLVRHTATVQKMGEKNI